MVPLMFKMPILDARLLSYVGTSSGVTPSNLDPITTSLAWFTSAFVDISSTSRFHTISCIPLELFLPAFMLPRVEDNIRSWGVTI